MNKLERLDNRLQKAVSRPVNVIEINKIIENANSIIGKLEMSINNLVQENEKLRNEVTKLGDKVDEIY